MDRIKTIPMANCLSMRETVGMKKIISAISLLALIFSIPTVSAQAKDLAGSSCSPSGATYKAAGNNYSCSKVKGKLVWVKSSASSSANSAPQISVAQGKVNQGCAAFMPAVQKYYSTMQIFDLTVVNGYFLEAKLQDPQFIPLWNAFGLLVAVVQNRSDASSYDKAQALAVFNAACHSNISIN